MPTEVADNLSTVPNFTLNGTTWQCCIVDDGHAYEWRSVCGQYAVIRDGQSWRAKRRDRLGSVEYPTIVLAMFGASNEQRRAA